MSGGNRDYYVISYCFNYSFQSCTHSILDQAFATPTGNISARAPSRDTRASPNPFHPLQPDYWKDILVKMGGNAFAEANKPDYFKKYNKKNPASANPITTIDARVAGINTKDAKHFCVYRCMDKGEAEKMTIDLKDFEAEQPCNLIMGQITGHLGHLDQARLFCPMDPPPEDKILVEFVLKPGAHDLLFSPDVAALGTESRKTALLAEVATRKNLGQFVVKKTGEGYVNGYIGIKSEENYYSLAMQANKKGEVKDNNTKRLFSALTAYVRAIKPGTEAECEIPTPTAPTPTPTPTPPSPVP